ncbi:N-acylglucosamine 2-epimerase [Beutenbergia cavernae DSM 12333]|uniref:N-acylglucosamine 2-epimerase n=1 Tax=Beutenbergia cavernae (strain ATCC BAA-8 / DSM 12333 / CCUG 43141 / JCM 11478 / NBRC 16432 / NCIMB 13614 / HKI 0122) TaxID=471853 RepID=C5C1I7_BEUC1|nr:AGE family epimerase/isomerase [Beutenbergia cavernae]ACQ81597.1 N-acylglucosamine 2-epimerase [Beutenbergia cavernae DSM 12333]
MRDGADYAAHLVDDVLAWWMSHGPDAEHGGVLTCWSNDGARLVSHDKYTWSQGRWAWLTARVAQAARAGVLAVDPEPYAEQAERTARFVRDRALCADRTTAYVTTRAGEPFEPVPGRGLATSVFADLFAALGFAGVEHVRPGEGWGELSLEVLRAAAERIASGEFRSDPYPVPPGYGSFGLPMILVGVGEQVYRATADTEAAAIVRAAAADIGARFVRGDDVVEMPGPGGVDDPSLLARHRTPGHVLEALWFLRHARDLLGEARLADDAELAAIARRALALGWDEERGGLFRYVDAAGGAPAGERDGEAYTELVVATWDTKLWWPHAEALYTTRLLASATGDPALAAWAERVESYTFATFPDGSGREWTQIRDRSGAPDARTVALPVKDPFHIARALLMLVELDPPAGLPVTAPASEHA